MSTSQTLFSPPMGGLPLDLRDWLSRPTLVRLALEAVQILGWKRPSSASSSGAHHVSQQMMATLLTYCYATGVYGSQDIAIACKVDPTVRYICAREYPDDKTIRRFRREHRPLLGRALAHLLLYAWALRLDQGQADDQGDGWIEPRLPEHVEVAANRRVEAASIIDTALADV